MNFYILTDCDPNGIEIALTYIYGSSQNTNTANLALPNAKWIGMCSDYCDKKFYCLTSFSDKLISFAIPFSDYDKRKIEKVIKRMEMLHIQSKVDHAIQEQATKLLSIQEKYELEAIQINQLAAFYIPMRIKSNLFYPCCMEGDNTFISFRDVAFLQSFPLNEFNVLEYFSLSPFYEATCNNQVLKMQTVYNQRSGKLEDLVGIEYSLVEKNQENTLFVIMKGQRYSLTTVVPICHYYVLAGVIYAGPLLNNVFECRLSNSNYFLSEALKQINSIQKKGENETKEEKIHLSSTDQIIVGNIFHLFQNRSNS